MQKKLFNMSVVSNFFIIVSNFFFIIYLSQLTWQFYLYIMPQPVKARHLIIFVQTNLNWFPYAVDRSLTLCIRSLLVFCFLPRIIQCICVHTSRLSLILHLQDYMCQEKTQYRTGWIISIDALLKNDEVCNSKMNIKIPFKYSSLFKIYNYNI